MKRELIKFLLFILKYLNIKNNISRINLIDMALLFNIRDKLNKEKIKNTDLLINRIRMYYTGCNKQKREDR